MILTSILLNNSTDVLAIISIVFTFVGIGVTIVVAVLVYNFQNTSTRDMLKMEHTLNTILDNEIQLYGHLTQAVAECYSYALGLHPSLGLGGGPSSRNFEARDTWHRERCNELFNKARTVLVLTEAYVSFFPEKIIDDLKKFGDICLDQACDYTHAYIQEAQIQIEPEICAYWQNRCYERNSEIKAAYEAFQTDMKTRMDELKKG
jgi:polyhydroxyalkanoate synthesis regulator phasin